MSLRHQRIFSAHFGSVSSANPKKRYEKIVTEGSQSNFRQFSQGSKKKSESFSRKGRNISRQLPKEPEQIMEENLNLKSFISNLQQQLTMQKNKFEISRRKNEKCMKQINRQFEKELYYSGKNPNSYLISGVKSQYENIKNLYEEKSLQLENVLKSIECTDLEELAIYVQSLKEDNKNLIEQLTTMKHIKSSFNEIYGHNFKGEPNPKGAKTFQHNNSGKLYTENSEDKSEESQKHVQVLTGMLADERASLGRANSIIEQYSEKIERMSSEREQLRKKIEFLEKLTIEKDNSEHQARRQLKKVEREKNQLEEEATRLKALVSSTQLLCEGQVNKIKAASEKQFQIEKSIFEKTLKQKNQYISKLEKQIRSLSAMLCYWKPLDQKNDIQSSLSRHDSPNSRDPKELDRQDKISSLKFNPQSEHNHRESVISDNSFSGLDVVGKNQNEMERSLRVNREEEGFLKRTITGNRSNSYQNAIVAIKERPRCECSRKYHENAKKTRKVDLNSIKEWGELLKYRLIGQNISLDKVKQYFNGTEEVQFQDYITMKEIKTILMNAPFSLKDEEATLVSRYMVQDSANEYVYWDEENEIYRSIAKSIMKAFIGNYELPDLKMIHQEWDKIKKIYLSNIMSALKTIAPKGLVTLTKLSELITGLGIEMTDTLYEWIIGELVVNSESMQQLKYELIQKI